MNPRAVHMEIVSEISSVSFAQFGKDLTIDIAHYVADTLPRYFVDCPCDECMAHYGRSRSVMQ